MSPIGGRTLWYGTDSRAELRAANIQSDFAGLSFDLIWQGQKQLVHSPLVGQINVWNILAASGAALSYGLDLAAIARGIEACQSVPGRFERIDCGQPFLVVVDFAHTEAALRNVISLVRQTVKPGARVITIFGCGGDRDRTKRPMMGAAAAELSDYVVITSDNPRSEDPLAIINDVMVGIGRHDTPHVSEPDRKMAIQRAMQLARPGDAVLLAGKGHETYQILKDRTIDFDDRVIARSVLESMGVGPAGNGK
jgi:UDP-N-acetylmuramoyl-L-alanyl-D-glutamate--2,6-diaminopimelate ligase